MKKIVVLGVGNRLMGDDGFGPRVIEALEKRDIPSNVEVMDAGVGGMAILSWIEGADKVVIIDSVQTGNEPPGTVYRFTDKELPPSDMFMLSLHDLNLVDTINIGRIVQKMPDEIIILGVEVKRVAEFDDRLTPEVEAAMAEVIDLVTEEIKK
ncbi:MAG TPA: hydrogenase maturation protease [Methanocella sp.]|jgi:hydrogenase maturation protease